MNQHQPHTDERVRRARAKFATENPIAHALHEFWRAQSEEHGRLVREGKARAKARREAEARARAAASVADQADK